jgi:hypothetical protein
MHVLWELWSVIRRQAPKDRFELTNILDIFIRHVSVAIKLLAGDRLELRGRPYNFSKDWFGLTWTTLQFENPVVDPDCPMHEQTLAGGCLRRPRDKSVNERSPDTIVRS